MGFVFGSASLTLGEGVLFVPWRGVNFNTKRLDREGGERVLFFSLGEKLRSILWKLEVFTGTPHCFSERKIKILIDMYGFYLSENRDKVLTNRGPHMRRRLCLMAFGPDIYECVYMLIDTLSSHLVGFSHLLAICVISCLQKCHYNFTATTTREHLKPQKAPHQCSKKSTALGALLNIHVFLKK